MVTAAAAALRFSAEHFGPNDYCYRDDFWAFAGLQAAADTMSACRRSKGAGAIGIKLPGHRPGLLRHPDDSCTVARKS